MGLNGKHNKRQRDIMNNKAVTLACLKVIKKFKVASKAENLKLKTRLYNRLGLWTTALTAALLLTEFL